MRAKVRVAYSWDGFRTVETMDLEPDESGRLALDLGPGAWVAISVLAPGCAPAWRSPVAWRDLDDRDLTFTLKPAAPVEGTSRWVSGKPMSNVRLAFAPAFPPGEYSGIVASKLKIVDEEVTTDAGGKFRCSSLRAENYRVTFPDHPKWPPLSVTANELRTGSLNLQTYWHEPSRR